MSEKKLLSFNDVVEQYSFRPWGLRWRIRNRSTSGQVIEEGSKEEMFNNPQNEQTRQYLNDEFCEC